MEGHLLMSQRERERLKLFERVKRDEMSLSETAEICGLSYRQTRRLFKRYREDGDRGLVHQGRGRPSNRAHPAEGETHPGQRLTQYSFYAIRERRILSLFVTQNCQGINLHRSPRRHVTSQHGDHNQ